MLDRVFILGRDNWWLKDNTTSMLPIYYLHMAEIKYKNFFSLLSKYNLEDFCDLKVCFSLQENNKLVEIIYDSIEEFKFIYDNFHIYNNSIKEAQEFIDNFVDQKIKKDRSLLKSYINFI